ncbi:hypothetical protein [Nostoc sp. CHAB 5715]|nr:hypothetical protein [Nostoc sp. CHAB 5715]MCC5621472.1 hypothetical protein [Nostoc sp. CHAB 5715]
MQQVFPLVPNSPCTLVLFPNAQCPMPNAQCPIPNFQCPIPKSCKI